MTAASPAGTGPDRLVLPDLQAWREWLMANESSHDGVWLALAKKGVTPPTSLTYQDALEEALCGGWIDGQRRSFDDTTFLQRFTPRRRASVWSQRNVGLIATLDAAGRLRERGHAEVALAKADGRWDAAYEGPATATVPVELRVALDQAPAAAARFEALTKSERYLVMHPVLTARNDAMRERRIAAVIRGLERP